MNNFWRRVITGILLIAVVVGLVTYGFSGFVFLVFFINILGLNEFYTLFSSQSPLKWPGIILSWFIYALSGLVISGIYSPIIFLFSIPASFILFIISLYKRTEKPFVELAFTFLGIIYITIPSVLLLLLSCPQPAAEYQPRLILGLFFLVWASDSGAYGSGKLFGKHTLFRRVSPGKTWEGSIGGALSALIVAVIVSHFFTEIQLSDWIIMALIVVVVGTYGDLVKSRLKRSLHVKDSGTILPGHGGILDRFDSLLGSAPFVLCYFLLQDHFRLK